MPKDVVNKGIEIGAAHIAPNIGAGAAAGSAAMAVIKATGGLPPFQRAIFASVTAGGVATSTSLGLKTASVLAKNNILSDIIKESPHSNPTSTRVPSPNPSFIICALESGEIPTLVKSPLEELLEILLAFELVNSVLIFILFGYRTPNI